MNRSVVISVLLIGTGCVPNIGNQQQKQAKSATNAENQVTEQVKAGVGVGIKGRSLDPHQGPLVTPAKALFAAKEKVVFEIQIPQALSLYNALEGRYPNSHDEFMEKIVQANNIVLPKLPDGHKYVYNVESHELQVERPAM